VFKNDDSKLQDAGIPVPHGLPEDVIVSPDTRRAERLPPGQKRTLKWPVLDAGGAPRIDLAAWKFAVTGLVRAPVEWNWQDFLRLPRTRVFADFHCVTRWSRLGNLWEGVSARELVEEAGGLAAEARYAVARAYDYGWTTNMPLAQFLAEDSLVAIFHDGEPLTAEHGGPARLVVPGLYAWKSAKWIRAVEFLAADRAGFWEELGYHMEGDPWLQQRYRR
jgi:DMSO/TMAO reductase YedYZ molybdopterin-dependent catalytic subunit